MKRVKKHQVKTEKPETSTSQPKEKGEHDLAYFIHDRVELLHQVFQSIKPKDLKAMAPHSVRHISLDDLQELCLEELLGISSKRLCAILDGADPPSDTDSSSQSSEHLETISLDSISSDEDILSQDSKKHKKHKHRRKQKKKKPDNNTESLAPRAGLTVLELLELQARARAIRAQLRAQQAAEQPTPAPETQTHVASDNEVEIKEEPAEVVEISSDDERHPGLAAASDKNATKPPKTTEKPANEDNASVTKRINNLVITVPQNKPTRKIKLNRSKVSVTVANSSDKTKVETINSTERTVTVANEANNTDGTIVNDKDTVKGKDIVKGKKKRKGKKKVDKEGSDQDEITLQLSDSEKMDLLEDFDRKNYESVTSSSSEDSESSSSSNESCNESADDNLKQEVESPEVCKDDDSQKVATDNEIAKNDVNNKDASDNTEIVETNSIDSNKTKDIIEETDEIVSENVEIIETDKEKENKPEEQTATSTEASKLDSINVTVEVTSFGKVKEPETTNEEAEKPSDTLVICENVEKDITDDKIEEVNANVDDDKELSDVIDEDKNKNISEGELSENSSSEVEAFVVQPEVVCISDDETKDKKQKKKKNKKEKKAKKEKKSKKSKSDFRVSSDQNFYKEKETDNTLKEHQEKNNDIKSIPAKTQIDTNDIETVQDSDDSDIYEILELIELSDDSSCEVEGVSVLSKEPTAEEIEALSAKIDEIENVERRREEVVTDEQIKRHEGYTEEQNAENISWKDRYLDSKKVKNVLSTSNILNALRKKNKELKKKIEDSKKVEEAMVETEIVENVDEKVVENLTLEEGTIEHYNTLQGSTRYVNLYPVVEKPIEDNQSDLIKGEMKKDAKQLLKMYKKLLKYNDMTKQKDPEKRKKKKNKKNKEKDSVASDN